MGNVRRLWRRLVRSVHVGGADEELEREIASHLELLQDEYRRRGMTEADAAQAARRAFGAIEAAKERQRDERGFRWIRETAQDLRYAGRWLFRRPGFAAATITVLALAIGVNAAFFSLYSNYVLKPLPIRGVERHVSVSGIDRHGGSISTWRASEIEAFRRAAGSQFEGLYASDTFQALAVAPEQRQTMVTSVSGDYFALLGGTAILGRTLSRSDEHETVAVLSSVGWARFFPGLANPIGQRLHMRTTVLTVIGVMPADFTGTLPLVPDLWVGLGTEDALRARSPAGDYRREVFGLVAPGVSVERAQAALTATASHFPRPEEDAVARVELRPHRSLLGDGEDVGTAAALLFAAFWIVLFIACANLANLHLARAASRTHEIAMRLSLGATRGRIIRQLLTESMLTGVIGAAAGCVIAFVTMHAASDYAVALSGASDLTLLPISVDWRVLTYSVLLGLAAGLAFGLLPAIELTAPGLTSSTKGEQSSFAGRLRPRRMRNLLIGSQVAASLVLLIAGGVLIGNVQRLESVDPGYDVDRVFDLGLDPPAAATLALLEQQPGVGAVTAVAHLPLYGRLPGLSVTVDGRTTHSSYNYVDHRYFEALALPVEGRSFTAAEATGRANVAVISRAAARKLWMGGSPLGRTLAIDPRPGSAAGAGVYEVVGVVPDVVSGWLFEGKDSSVIYLPAAAGQPEIVSALARLTGDPAQTAAAIREVCVGAADATACEPASLRGAYAMQQFPFQIAAGGAGALGGLALLLTAIGLYSVASYSVVQRRREIGVLLALGASPSQVIRRILSEAWRCVVLGVAVGLPICLVLSKLAANSVLRIQTFDPAAHVSVSLLLVAIVTLACAGPARRATRLNPMSSLREE